VKLWGALSAAMLGLSAVMAGGTVAMLASAAGLHVGYTGPNVGTDVLLGLAALSALGQHFRAHLLPLNQLAGIQMQHQILEVLRFESMKDYEDWLARLQSFGVYLDQTLLLMRRGMAEGRMYPRVVMQRVSDQIAQQRVTNAQDSPYFAPFRNFPAAIAEEVRPQLAIAGQAAIEEVVLPAYQRLQEFFEHEYLPACPAAIAVSARKDGKAYYEYLVRYHTTTPLTPAQIHEIGLREVKRIRGEMQEVMRRSGYKYDLGRFFELLEKDRRFYYATAEELLDGYRVIAKRIDPELPRLFGKLPRTPYGVKAIPELSAPDAPGAYYYPAAADGSRAGNFYANTYKPETRPKWEMEALTAHEAVPGHHLQIALGQELGDLPQFRRNGLDYTAFVEGWGLYAESLGDELGLYQDPYSKFGQLSAEMWRAIRLVVDTGIHAKNWSRERAIDYFKANAGKSELDIANEVDRYIVWPGQALAYKIGQMKIQELRQHAQEKLGSKFDVRAFHDTVLGNGVVPLDVLETKVNEWVAQRAASE
jgi:uncharacterized protein (DUF885 family)